MVGVSGIPLGCVTHRDMPSGWTAVNGHDFPKYQAIQIGPAWEANKMTVNTKLKACCLDGEGWLWIKAYNAQKDGKHATANLSEHYEVSRKFNNHVAW